MMINMSTVHASGGTGGILGVKRTACNYLWLYNKHNIKRNIILQNKK